MDQLVNPKHVAYASDGEHKLCSTDSLYFLCTLSKGLWHDAHIGLF